MNDEEIALSTQSTQRCPEGNPLGGRRDRGENQLMEGNTWLPLRPLRLCELCVEGGFFVSLLCPYVLIDPIRIHAIALAVGGVVGSALGAANPLSSPARIAGRFARLAMLIRDVAATCCFMASFLLVRGLGPGAQGLRCLPSRRGLS